MITDLIGTSEQWMQEDNEFGGECVIVLWASSFPGDDYTHAGPHPFTN